MKHIKLVSWNVNGLRAAVKKDFFASLEKLDADVIGLQETKLQADQRTQAMRDLDGYDAHWAYATVKKGYSGTVVYTRIPGKEVKTGIGIDRYDNEGRIVELDFGDFIFFNIYFPNGQMSDERLAYKLDSISAIFFLRSQPFIFFS